MKRRVEHRLFRIDDVLADWPRQHPLRGPYQNGVSFECYQRHAQDSVDVQTI